jgi:hypothetical protein
MDGESALAESCIDTSLLNSTSFPSSSSSSAFPSSFDPSAGSTLYPSGATFFDASQLSPRSRAFSTSSVSSVASSAHSRSYEATDSPSTSAGSRPSLDLPPATLRPSCDAEGFVVESVTGGACAVGWDELVSLLLQRTSFSSLPSPPFFLDGLPPLPTAESTAYLPQQHVISQLAGFLAGAFSCSLRTRGKADLPICSSSRAEPEFASAVNRNEHGRHQLQRPRSERRRRTPTLPLRAASFARTASRR